MVRKFLAAGSIILPLALFACMDSDSSDSKSPENDSVSCTNGEDDDGDFDYDCYDSDCRVADSIAKLNGGAGFCDYGDRSSSSQAESAEASSSAQTSSSSVGISSSISTAASSSSSAFPRTLAGSENDSIQVNELFYKASTGEIGFVGRLGSSALSGVMDTTGTMVQSVREVTFPEWDQEHQTQQATYGDPGTLTLTGLDTSLDGNFTGYGASTFSLKKDTTLPVQLEWLSSSTSAYFWSMKNAYFSYMGVLSDSSYCYVTTLRSTVDTGFVVAKDVSDSIRPYNRILKSVMVAGEVVQTGTDRDCAGLANRTSNDSSQIWYLLVNASNITEENTKITTGSSKEEVAYDFETVDGATYVAASVDDTVRVLIRSGSTVTPSAALAMTTPHHIRTVTDSGTTYLLVLGENNGVAAASFLSTDGSITNEFTNDTLQVFTDAVQINDNTLLFAGLSGASSMFFKYPSDMVVRE
ncbi:MAG TPA: hypothetical protein VLM37_11815 [Fibrobacteraceae bacterium]|nr:hypothetical protein [Fibrobacteraceae bacterium]